ncbi:OmpH family outer membrane protein [Mannheimia sp. AT1]|uniref:OmpH family outer membrane protein n=1 Tax=Mannheimia cairinae TaxID=3025936 RepID=A0ABT5MNE4_9PAST|nr:OmpH family outer membrane protein [Mannheimia cairinae]MDD0823707.1 OmpH family outer membrane protein [Mannheimia cairinae]MDD0825361.1 OmpH family outer membrane protein [Mannheimia cairinae]
MKKLFKIATLTAALATTGMATAADTIGFVDPSYVLQNHPVLLDATAKFEKFIKESQAKFAEDEKKLAEENKKLTAERDKINSDAEKLQKEQKTVEASIKKKVAALEKEAPRLRSKDIQARQNAIQKEADAFQKKVDAIQKREAEFAKKAEAFQKQADEFQQKIEQANKENGGLNPQEAQKQAVDEVNATIKEIAKSKGYTLVLQPQVALYAEDESKDITETVLNAIIAKHPNIKLEQPAEKAEEQKSEATEAKPEEAKK